MPHVLRLRNGWSPPRPRRAAYTPCRPPIRAARRAGRYRRAMSARRGQKGVMGPWRRAAAHAAWAPPCGHSGASYLRGAVAQHARAWAPRPAGRPVCSRMKLGPAGVDVGAAAHANPGGDTPRGGRTSETPERGSLPPDARGGRAHRLRMQPFGNIGGRLGDEARWNTISTSTVWRDSVAEHQKVAGWVAGKRRRRARTFRLRARVPTDPGTETESGWAPPFGGVKVSH